MPRMAGFYIRNIIQKCDHNLVVFISFSCHFAFLLIRAIGRNRENLGQKIIQLKIKVYFLGQKGLLAPLPPLLLIFIM